MLLFAIYFLCAVSGMLAGMLATIAHKSKKLEKK